MSLLNVDPTQLFENHSVDEIENIRIKIRHEIEKKKEDLRVMVGERYRDLIDAADSITNMTVLSQGVLNDLDSISSKCSSTSASKISSNLTPSITIVDRFVSQLKLLIDMNQDIWYNLDERRILQAAILYQYAFYIKTNINIEIPSNNKLINLQWKTMNHFQKTIVNYCEKYLLEQNMNSEQTCDCLLAFIMIENLNANQAFERYLLLKNECLKNCLKTNGEDSNDCKNNILNSYNIIVNTIICIYEIFNETNGILITFRDDVFNTKIINLINKDELTKRYSKYLPEIILNYKIDSLDLTLIKNDSLRNKLLDWLSKTKQDIQIGVENNLKYVLSLKLTQDIYNNVDKQPVGLNNIFQCLEQNDIHVWDEMYNRLILEKAKQLIVIKWNHNFDALNAEILRAIKSSNSEKNKESELDLRWYTWKESNNDLEFHEKKRDNGEQNSTTNISGLLLKSYGYTPRVVSLCNSIQSKIQNLEKDLKNINNLNNNNILSKYQRNCCQKSIAKLVEFINEQIQHENITTSSCLLLARFSECLTQFCPALQNCLSNKIDNTFDDEVNDEVSFKTNVDRENVVLDSQSWNEVVALLLSCSHKACDQYIKLSKSFYLDMFSEVNNNITTSYMLQTISKWETISMEEKNESGAVVQSNIHVPSEAGIFLQESLLRFTSNLSRLSPSNYLREQLVNEILKHLLTKYNPLIDDTSNNQLVQRNNIQSIFDLKYISNVLNIKNQNKLIKQEYNLKINEIEKVIDVFELEVINNHLNENVNKCVSKTQCLLGINSAHAHSTISTNTHAQPCIIPMSNNVQWFPLLLLNNTNASSMISLPNMNRPLNQSNNTSKTSSSFFAVSDWFA